VTANIVANFAPPLQFAKLHYRVNGVAPFGAITMINTTGNTYSALIPGQNSPALIEYYVSAKDSTAVEPNLYGQIVEFPVTLRVGMGGIGGSGGEGPEGATPEYLRIYVGSKTTHFFDNLEGGGAGWDNSGSSGPLGEWQLGTPLGFGSSPADNISWSDPNYAHSGQNCWGNDLTSDGKYDISVNGWLLTPSVSLCIGNPPVCTASPPDRVFLRSMRWLSVAASGLGASSDFGEIKVLRNGSEESVWVSHKYVPHVDSSIPAGSWVASDIEITDAIGGAQSIQIKWYVRDDGIAGRQLFGGWNIDDVEVFAIRPLN
jgi:hypothetical protein